MGFIVDYVGTTHCHKCGNEYTQTKAGYFEARTRCQRCESGLTTWTPYKEPVMGNDTILPTEATARKNVPITTGCLDYFPAALAAVAEVSRVGNDQHNPGQPMHWARGKSTDQEDCILRHLMERGTRDKDGLRHSAKLAWRALALLQLELEKEGAPIARGAHEPTAN